MRTAIISGIHGNIEVLQAMRLLQVNSIKLSITTDSSDFI